jgi:hypothetical protein
MKKIQLTEQDFQVAAAQIQVDIPAIKAVAEIESANSGFLSSGEPVILFERHVFHQRTGGKFSASHPDLSNKTPGGYGGVQAQHGRLQRAAELDHNAALESASWGRFQVMGYHWKALGYKSLQEFINGMYAGVDGQLEAFIRYVKVNRLDADLRRHDWASFARGYNGPGYKKNAYDTKLAAAWKRHGGK